MIVGAYVRRAAPDHPAGAEWTMQDTLAALTKRGHDCRIVSEQGATRARISGVLVYSQPDADEVERHFGECDVMLTQMEATSEAQFLSVLHHVPLVHLVHSPNALEAYGVMPGAAALVVYNSRSVAEACSWWPGAGQVLRPVIDEDRVRVEAPGACATLVNLSHEKGGMTLAALATELERVPFLGIMGAYGDQALWPDGIPGSGDNPLPAPLPQNLRVVGATPRIAEMFSYVRVLLVLSRSETYGRIAGEALVSGIPVIARHTPGVEECLGPSAVYVEQDASTREIARLVKQAYTPEWDDWHNAALDRARYNRDRAEDEVGWLEQHLERIASDQPVMRLDAEPHV